VGRARAGAGTKALALSLAAAQYTIINAQAAVFCIIYCWDPLGAKAGAHCRSDDDYDLCIVLRAASTMRERTEYSAHLRSRSMLLCASARARDVSLSLSVLRGEMKHFTVCR